MAPKIITIGNNKGGVGKTTTCVNLASGLARAGRRVLAVDGDPQANTTASLIDDIAQRDEKNLVAAFEEDAGTLTGHAVASEHGNLALVPNSIKCMEWEVRSFSSLDSVFGLKRLIDADSSLDDYDYVIIDTPPNIGPMLRNALLVSDYVLVPCPVGDQFALDGFSTFLKVLGQAKAQNEGLQLMGAVLTKYDGRSWTHKSNKRAITTFFEDKGIPVLETIIRVNIDLDRAHTNRSSIFELDKRKAGARDYKALAEEVIRHG